MPGFNTIPGSSGGGGQPNMTYVGSILLSTYNRSWAQAGTSGYYGIYSGNQENGYAYFVGTSMTTGVALNKVANISHSFTRIDIVGVASDMISLYKVKLKATTLYNNPTANFTRVSAVLGASGSFVLPSNAPVPFADLVIVGGGGSAGGGHGQAHGRGSGGGGGNVVTLTDFSIFGSTIVSVGAGGVANSPGSHNGNPGGQSSFGGVYALGGGGGSGWTGSANPLSGAGNGGGGSNSSGPGTGTTQTSLTGLGTLGSPGFHGGFSGGSSVGSNGSNNVGGGGGGATAAGSNGTNGSGGQGGAGHISTITGSSALFGYGGSGYAPNGTINYSYDISGTCYGCGGSGSANPDDGSNVIGRVGRTGVVVVRYYTP